MQTHHCYTVHVCGKGILFGCVVGFLFVPNRMLPSLVGARDADCDPQAHIHHFLMVPFGSDSTVVHGPEVTQVFHGLRASCGSKVRMCCDV